MGRKIGFAAAIYANRKAIEVLQESNEKLIAEVLPLLERGLRVEWGPFEVLRLHVREYRMPAHQVKAHDVIGIKPKFA